MLVNFGKGVRQIRIVQVGSECIVYCSVLVIASASHHIGKSNGGIRYKFYRGEMCFINRGLWRVCGSVAVYAKSLIYITLCVVSDTERLVDQDSLKHRFGEQPWRILVKYIVKEVEEYLKTYPSAGLCSTIAKPPATVLSAEGLLKLQMAYVALQSHNGDAGGDPPDDQRPRILPHQCQGSVKHEESKHKALKKAFKQNSNHKPEIVFEAKDQKTFKQAIQETITVETIPSKTDRKLLAEVTQSINRYCTREQLENLKRQHASQKVEQAFESQQNALKKFVDFFNRHQGAHSQFQIHDLYTPQVFPRSISTPGGPSFTSPASSSNPFALSYCYTPTFHPETSQSGQQDNNGSDDRNREYDVDIYDEEQGLCRLLVFVLTSLLFLFALSDYSMY
nr:hypothetical protein [Tanacetum cinerariifolium]